jgi:hypothetical protein
MQNYKQQEGIIQYNKSKFVIVKVNETEYTIDNWYGTKKKFNISNKDLPLQCKGKVIKFIGKFLGSKIKRRNFIIESIVNHST